MEITKILSEEEVTQERMDHREALQYFWLMISIGVFGVWLSFTGNQFLEIISLI